MVGRSTLAAPINCAGVFLSQPPRSTTPSMGLARIVSSTAMLIRLRKSIVVGTIWVSPSDMAGNSSGTPPASHTPRLTNSATSSRWLLQGVSSDQELQIPMTGRPSKAWSGRPSERNQERWMNRLRSWPSNQRRLLNSVIGSPRVRADGPTLPAARARGSRPPPCLTARPWPRPAPPPSRPPRPSTPSCTGPPAAGSGAAWPATRVLLLTTTGRPAAGGTPSPCSTCGKGRTWWSSPPSPATTGTPPGT